jgi:hypothetical protein
LPQRYDDASSFSVLVQRAGNCLYGDFEVKGGFRGLRFPILIMPRLLNYIVAIYLIITGVLGLVLFH